MIQYLPHFLSPLLPLASDIADLHDLQNWKSSASDGASGIR